MLSPPALDDIPSYQTYRQGLEILVGPVRENQDLCLASLGNPQGQRAKTIVIIGAGAAGNAAAETLRKEGYNGKVVMVTREPELPYDRTALSKGFLTGSVSTEQLALRSAEFYTAMGIEILTGSGVLSIDPSDRRVVLENGGGVRYDKLLLASGGVPKRLNLPGAELEGCHYLRSKSDAVRIVEALPSCRRPVVVGAGFIGLEVASALGSRELPVQVVAPERLPMGAVLGESVGSWIRELHESQGVLFHLGRTVRQLRGSRRVEEVILSDESTIETDLVIVGAGNVGATSAYALMLSGLAGSIVLVDIDRQRAEGQAMDLNHGLPFAHPTKIFAGQISDCQDAAAVVITAGANQKPGETRLNLARKNADVFKEIIPKVSARNPRILLIVTNPVDVLTYLTLHLSKLSTQQVIGSGTVLDTARFRYLIGNRCGVDPRNVHGYVVGEHGDSEVALWSQVTIAGLSFDEYCTLHGKAKRDLKSEITNQVRTSAYEIIKRKGATNFAVGLVVVRILSGVFRDENSILTVSTQVGDEFGIRDVCLSVPAVLNRNGISQLIHMRMDERENCQFYKSAEVLQEITHSLIT